MSKHWKRRAKKIGLPPGALIHIGQESLAKIKLSYLDYSENSFEEEQDTTIDRCLKCIQTPGMTWIQVSGVSDTALISNIGNHFHLHSLILEDILTTTQRAKLDTYDNQVFFVARYLDFDNSLNELKDEQISLVFGDNFLISFLESDHQLFQPVIDRLRQGNVRLLKEGSGYLAYSLIDLIVDQYFHVLEKADTFLEELEEEVEHFPKKNTLQKIQKSKREIILLRKSIWPMREAIGRFQKLELSFISPTVAVYLRDVYDHLIQTMDVVEGFRDIVSGMMDVYLSNINVRMNEIMKVLTIVSTIFVPLTFITSLYGMNFQHMPELTWKYGYLTVCILMMCIAAGMIYFFHRKKWF